MAGTDVAVVDDIRADIARAMEITPERETGRDIVEVESREVQPQERAATTEVAVKADTSTPGRDVSGRFSPRVPAKIDEEHDEGDPSAKDAGRAAEPDQPAAEKITPQSSPLRPPVSWTPEAREEWDKVPARVQQEVYKRDREINEALRVSAEARNFANEIYTVVNPYMPMIQAERSTPAGAIQALFQTAAALRTGTPINKATLVADLIKTYGVDITQLDQVLTARVSGGAPADPRPPATIDPRTIPELQPLFQAAERLRTEEQHQTVALQSDTEAFMNDPANEFVWDVKDDMADLLDLASKRGQKITLQDAYNRAIMLHPTISGIVQKRGGANGVGTGDNGAAARRARNAAVSIPSNGAPGQASEDEAVGDDVRSAIVAAIKKTARR